MSCFLMVGLTLLSVPSSCVELERSFSFLENIYTKYPLWLLGRQKQSYSNSDSFLGLLRLGADGVGCRFGTVLALSVGSGIRVGDCVGPG